MYVVSVTVFVQPDRARDFIDATLENGRHTRREAGNVRFDILQCVDPTTRFLLYEVYRTPDDFKAHQQTQHYLKWRETVADWMAQPRQGVKHNSLFPPDDQW